MLSPPDAPAAASTAAIVPAYDETGLAAVTHYAVSALRTANAFTIPFDRLSESTAVAIHGGGTANRNGTDEAAACQWLVSQLSPYHSLSLLSAAAAPPRKCIIYLEPRRTSSLYTAIERFFAVSADRFGPTEAHMYHPHSSMTGFIDIPATCGDESLGLVAEISAHLDVLIKDLLSPSLAAAKMPKLVGVNTARNYPHPGTHKIEAKLDTPAVFREIVDAMQRLVPQARIRPKKIGHISLAYYNKHVKTEHRIEDHLAAEMHTLAESLLATSPVDGSNKWDIAFYELALESPALYIPHRFNQIARWHL